MVWIYDNPPYTSRELRAYAFLRKKLKDKKFVDSLIKLLSLTVYLKNHKFKTAKEIQESAYYDKAQTKPIFDEKTAKLILKGTTQKGGDDKVRLKKMLGSKYPYLNIMLRGILLDYSPQFLISTIGAAYAWLTGAVDSLEKSPVVELGLALMHGLAEFSVTSANDISSAIAGESGAILVAPFTAVVAGLASIIATAEGDIGGAVAHILNWIPGLGIILNKWMLEMEHFAKKLEGHPTVAKWIPYMTEFTDVKTHVSQSFRDDVYRRPPSAPPPPSTGSSPSAPPVVAASGGKRLSTRKRKGRKWPKTMRRRGSAMY